LITSLHRPVIQHKCPLRAQDAILGVLRKRSQRGAAPMEAGKGKSSDFRLSQASCLSGGQKGCLRRLHFMRPFAPCFASREDG